DLELEAKASPTYLQNGPVEYQITLNASGLVTNRDVQVKHVKSGHFWRYENVRPSIGSFNPQTGIWTIPQLLAFETHTLKFVGWIVDQESPQIDFFEVIAASNTDPDSTPDNDNGAKTADEDDEAAIFLFPSNPADLIVDAFTVPTNIMAGDALAGSLVLKNTGRLPAYNSDAAIYLSVDPIWDSEDTRVGSSTLRSIGPDFSERFDIQVTIRAAQATGHYFLIAYADPDERIYEVDETNNFKAVAVYIEQVQPETYCSVSSNFPWHDWIAFVGLGDIQHVSGKSKYSDFTFKQTELAAGGTYPISLTTAFSYFTWDEYYRVWIDYNQNKIFEAEEMAFEGILNAPPHGSQNAGLKGMITIPTDAKPGATGMRVIMSRAAFPTACESIDFGEIEDYTVHLVEAQDAKTRNAHNDHNNSFTSNSNEFEIFPNPATNLTFVKYTTTQGKLMDVSIVNAMGQIVYTYSWIPAFGDKLEIDTSSFNEGIYFIQIKNENDWVATQRLVIVRDGSTKLYLNEIDTLVEA
ncbi:MAG: GEVED domain-containing protein, partial [Bacteroidota bacterium]